MKNKKVAEAYEQRHGRAPVAVVPSEPEPEPETKPKSEKALVYTLALSLAILAKEVMDQWP